MINNTDQLGSHQREDSIMNNVEGVDRLSTLPDDLIYKILSIVSIKEAIGTSFLSSRWRSTWTSIPYLNFVSGDFNFFPQPHGFSKFVLNALSRLDHQIQVSSVNFHDWEVVSHDFVKTIVKYAVSHNVQQLIITCYFDSKIEFPLSVFSSKSLKHLTFGLHNYTSTCNVSPPWELPALTTLHLDGITLSDEHHTTTDKCIGFFSKCPNLKNLYLNSCKIEGTNIFNIFHPTLSNLTVERTFRYVEVINVVTPQLKNLTIRFCSGKQMIFAPELTSFVFKGYSALHHSTEGFPFLEKLDLFIDTQKLAVAHELVCLLPHQHTVRFLTLNLSLLKFLSSSRKLISHQPCAFRTLKISKFLTIDGGIVYMEAQEEVIMTGGLKSQTTSPSAIFPLISCEEIEVMRKMVIAQEPIKILQLWACEGKSGKKRGCKRKRGKVQVKKHSVESAFEMQWHFEEMMTQIEQGKIDGYVTEELPTFQTRSMISRLQCVEGLLTELPASKRFVLQATFSSMCAEAAILMNKMMDRMRKPVILRSCRSRKPKLNQDPSFIYE